jgi:chromosomal replication initiator protein
VSPTIRDIELAICLNFNITKDILRGPDRKRRYARPRQIAMALSRELTDMSLSQIGRHYCRDHTTVLHAIARIRDLSEVNPKVAAHVEDCRTMLQGVLAHRAIQTADYLKQPLVQARAA